MRLRRSNKKYTTVTAGSRTRERIFYQRTHMVMAAAGTTICLKKIGGKDDS